MTARLLLDTCVVIWASQGQRLAAPALAAIEAAGGEGEPPRISAMSAWELGMLVARGRLPTSRPPLRWFEEFVAASQSTVEPLTPAILVAASFLPGPIHNDPMDRILIATARERDLTIVTRDRAILGYAGAGHVAAIPC